MSHKKVLVGFGNSLTYGYMVRKGYLDYLQDLLGAHCKIINSGIPGDTVLDGLRRIKESVLKYNPDITIIEFALNDAFSNFTVNEFKRNYQEIINKIDKIKVIVTPHKTFDNFITKAAKPFYDTLKILSHENNLPLIDISKYTFSRKELLSDNVHPNEKGYEIYAKEVYKVIGELIDQ
jgi:acyl-CoA thioesterase-1